MCDRGSANSDFERLARFDLGNDAERRVIQERARLLPAIAAYRRDARGPNAAPSPAANPSDKRNDQRAADILGDDGPPGKVAVSTTNTLLAPTPPAISTSLKRCSRAVIERLVGIDLAFENIVFDAALLQIENIPAQSLDPLLHFIFLIQRRIHRPLYRIPSAFAPQPPAAGRFRQFGCSVRTMAG